MKRQHEKANRILSENREKLDELARYLYEKETITGDEFFVQGHFPGNPIVPGVIQCEMLAQNCCVLLADDLAAKGATPMYTSLDKVRFKHPVRPGDTVELTCRITRSRGPFRFATGEARVNGELCCQAEMSFALM